MTWHRTKAGTYWAGGPLPVKTPRGVIECPACGKRIRPGARKKPHEESPECTAQQVVNAYDARGWAQVFNLTIGRIIEESGAPIEWNHGAWHTEVTTTYDAFGVKTEIERDVTHLVGFSPHAVIRVCMALNRVQMTGTFRRRALKALWQREDLLEAIEAIKRLDGRVPGFIHQAVMQAEAETAGVASDQ